MGTPHYLHKLGREIVIFGGFSKIFCSRGIADFIFSCEFQMAISCVDGSVKDFLSNCRGGEGEKRGEGGEEYNSISLCHFGGKL